MKTIKADAKSGKFKRVYLLFGEERYLVKYYENFLREKILPDGAELMNLDIFDGADTAPGSYLDAAQTMPFLSERRLVLIRDSELFVPGRKADSERVAAFLPQIPEEATLLFVEMDVDKRSRLYKKVNELGHAAEMKTPKDPELQEWVAKALNKRGRSISQGTAAYLIQLAAHSMQAIIGEIEKLVSYTEGSGQVTQADIDAICSPAVEAQIFALTSAIGQRDPARALDIFSDMILLKQQPMMVLVMITRQFRLITETKALREQGLSAAQIAAALSLRSFQVSEYMSQSRNFTLEELTGALRDCQEMDMGVKSGRIGDKLAVEALIMRYGAGGKA